MNKINHLSFYAIRVQVYILMYKKDWFVVVKRYKIYDLNLSINTYFIHTDVLQFFKDNFKIFYLTRLFYFENTENTKMSNVNSITNILLIISIYKLK